MNEDLNDVDFGRTISFGAVIGIPVTFMLLLAAMVLVVDEPGVAPAMAWTALVGGGYFGGFVALNLALGQFERYERDEAAARRNHPSAQRTVTGQAA